MKTTAALSKTTADDDLLNNTQFDPVFDSDGNLIDIVHLKVTTDRSRGIKAMLELANSTEENDAMMHQDGFTQKQKRILNSPAPGPAHTIKRSKRWDSSMGMHVATATLILPYEVIWVLFEELFANQYSIRIKETVFDSEDVPGSGVEGARDLPGRIFYARSTVTIVLHLSNGTQREFEGVGVAYDSVRMDMTGNVYAINSARRTAEKGAVSDAKREALSNMGRVFRRAFEDGDKALEAIEEKLMEKIRSNNEKRTRTSEKTKVAAPVSKKDVKQEKEQSEEDWQNKDPGYEDEYLPYDAQLELENASKKEDIKTESEPKNQDKDVSKADDKDASEKVEAKDKNVSEENETDENVSAKEEESEKGKEEKTPEYTLLINEENHKFSTPGQVYDAAIEQLDVIGEPGEQIQFLEKNKSSLLKAQEDDEIGDLDYTELLEMVQSEPVVASEPQKEAQVKEKVEEKQEKNVQEETSDKSDFKLTPKSNKGADILRAYEDAFAKCKSQEEKNNILDANTALAKRLTARQKKTLTQMSLLS